MQALPIALLIAQGFCIFSLGRRHQVRMLAWLIAYLGLSMLCALVLGTMHPRASEYWRWWTWFTPLVVAIQTGVALEAWNLALADAPRVGRASHGVAWLAALAGGLVAGALRVDHSLGGIAAIQLGVAVLLAIGVVTSAALIAALRIPRSPAVVAHGRILALHFGSVALLLWLVQSGYAWASDANAWQSIACCLLWARLPNTPKASIEGDPAAADEFLRLEHRIRNLRG